MSGWTYADDIQLAAAMAGGDGGPGFPDVIAGAILEEYLGRVRESVTQGLREGTETLRQSRLNEITSFSLPLSPLTSGPCHPPNDLHS